MKKTIRKLDNGVDHFIRQGKANNTGEGRRLIILINSENRTWDSHEGGKYISNENGQQTWSITVTGVVNISLHEMGRMADGEGCYYTCLKETKWTGCYLRMTSWPCELTQRDSTHLLTHTWRTDEVEAATNSLLVKQLITLLVCLFALSFKDITIFFRAKPNG